VRPQEIQKSRMSDFASAGFINYICTKLATFPSRKIYSKRTRQQVAPSHWTQNGFSVSFGQKRSETGSGFSVIGL
jgi:hypothetical protein